MPTNSIDTIEKQYLSILLKLAGETSELITTAGI